MPTIQYCSDLHLEIPLNAQFMKKYPLQVSGNVLVLAGDIVPYALMDQHKDFFSLLSDNYEQVYWLPGNHEYYHGNMADNSSILHEPIRSNVLLVNNTSVVYDDTELIFSTLWSKITPANEWQIERAMSDFHVIKYKGLRYNIVIYNELHRQCVAFIQRALALSTAKNKIVVTHHVPTYMNYPPQYKNSILSEAFATELSDMIFAHHIHSWIYGHHHVNTADFKIGETMLRTNQLGYIRHGEQTDFDRGKVITP